jgi:hypothetical protein
MDALFYLRDNAEHHSNFCPVGGVCCVLCAACCVCCCAAMQITTTLPVRTAFYSQETDTMRILFEVLLHLCLLVVLSLQVGVWEVLAYGQ